MDTLQTKKTNIDVWLQIKIILYHITDPIRWFPTFRGPTLVAIFRLREILGVLITRYKLNDQPMPLWDCVPA